MIENALILAAGKGTRMWPLTENIPKPLLPICGLPIIERQIQELKKVGVKKLYILIGYQMKELSDYLGGTKYGIDIKYIVQEKQKGTGHAVSLAKKHIDGDFYCLNGDTVINEKNLNLLKQTKNGMAMMITSVEDGSAFGVVKCKGGVLEDIIEKVASVGSFLDGGAGHPLQEEAIKLINPETVNLNINISKW